MMPTKDTPKQAQLACGAAIVRDNKILLIQRLTEPEAGCWGIPGGKVDWLETVEHAVVREIREEVGIELAGISFLCLMNQIDAARGVHWVAPIYLATDFAGSPRICEPHKHAGLAWCALDAPPAPLTLAAMQAIAALR